MKCCHLHCRPDRLKSPNERSELICRYNISGQEISSQRDNLDNFVFWKRQCHGLAVKNKSKMLYASGWYKRGLLHINLKSKNMKNKDTNVSMKQTSPGILSHYEKVINITTQPDHESYFQKFNSSSNHLSKYSW